MQAFVEGSGVGGLVAQIDVELLFVENGAGVGVHAGVLETLGALGQPAVFGHIAEQESFR